MHKVSVLCFVIHKLQRQEEYTEMYLMIAEDISLSTDCEPKMFE